jgi:hypothetical protein
MEMEHSPLKAATSSEDHSTPWLTETKPHWRRGQL